MIRTPFSASLGKHCIYSNMVLLSYQTSKKMGYLSGSFVLKDKNDKPT